MQKRRTESNNQGRPRRKLGEFKLVKSKLLLPGIMVVGVIAIVYSTIVVGRLTASVSLEEKLSENISRIEVLNASQDASAMREFCKLLDGYQDEQLEIHVVDSSQFSRVPIEETILIPREQEQPSTGLLAELIGLEESRLNYRPLEYNKKMVTATVILGNDFDLDVIRKNISEKEQ